MGFKKRMQSTSSKIFKPNSAADAAELDLNIDYVAPAGRHIVYISFEWALKYIKHKIGNSFIW